MALGCRAEQEVDGWRDECQFCFSSHWQLRLSEERHLENMRRRGRLSTAIGGTSQVLLHAMVDMYKGSSGSGTEQARMFPEQKKVATVLLLDEEVRQSLDWKTYFRRHPDTIQEPVALDQKGAPSAPPITHYQMQTMCDIICLVQEVEYRSQSREHCEYRHMVVLAKRQIFTQLSLVEEAGVHLCFDFILQNLLICVLFTAIVMSSSLMF